MRKRYLVTDGQLNIIKDLIDNGSPQEAKDVIDSLLARQYIGESRQPVIEDVTNLKILLDSFIESEEE